MKPALFSLALLTLAAGQADAQNNVGIGTASPEASAMLEIRTPNLNSPRGFLVPRMPSGSQFNIPSPARGLLIFDTTNNIFRYQGTAWRTLIDDSYWRHSTLGDYIYNATDSIGIGTTSPDAKLHVSNGDILISDATTPFFSKLAFNSLNTASGYNDHQYITFARQGTNAGGYIHFTHGSSGNSMGLGMNTGTDQIHLSDTGFVGINTHFPADRFHVAGNVRISNSGTFAMYKPSGLKTVNITAAESSTSGSAMTMYNDDGLLTIELDADYSTGHKGRMILDEIQIKGGSDFAEDFSLKTSPDEGIAEPGMLVSIDGSGEGKIVLSSKAYDKRVAGVVSGANGVSAGMRMGQRGTAADGDLPVALAGRVYVRTTEEGGAIKPGDFLTSSSTPGHAMKASSAKRAVGAIIGKAMTRRDPETGYVLLLINLQ